MKKKNNYRNVKVLAKKSDKLKGFDVYIDFSGKREYLIYHRPNQELYQVLKNGISLEALHRSSKILKQHNSDRPFNAMLHLIKVVDDYIEYRDEEALYEAA